jgi:putative glycosyltransferase
MRLSIVTTLYYSAPYIEEFYERICKAARKITDDIEVIFVNDGSPDNAFQKAISLCEKDKIAKVIDLSRNYGHHKAIMTGLAHADGDLVFLIDCDLEEKPEYLETFYREMVSSGADVVYGIQEIRKGGVREKITGAVYWKLFNT